MSLPTIDVPKYQTQLPSTGARVEYRPFLVREQKNLLIAVGGDADQQLQALKDTVQTCTFGQLNVDQLSAYDVEYLFLQIRARSIGENLDLVLRCQSCEATHEQSLDLTMVSVNKPLGHERELELEGLTLTLRDPGIDAVDRYRRDPGPDAVIELIAQCIESIWQGDDLYSAQDYTLKELVEFVEELSPRNLQQLESYFNTLPVLRHELHWTCAACSTDNTAVLEGLQGFFV